jgi:hypothetical protein
LVGGKQGVECRISRKSRSDAPRFQTFAEVLYPKSSTSPVPFPFPFLSPFSFEGPIPHPIPIPRIRLQLPSNLLLLWPPSAIAPPEQALPDIAAIAFKLQHLRTPPRPRTHAPSARSLPTHALRLQHAQPAPLVRPHRRPPTVDGHPVDTHLPPSAPRPRNHRYANAQPALPRRPSARRQRVCAHLRLALSARGPDTQFPRPLHRCALGVHYDGRFELVACVNVAVCLSACCLGQVERQQTARRAGAAVVVVWVCEVVLRFWCRWRAWDE